MTRWFIYAIGLIVAFLVGGWAPVAISGHGGNGTGGSQMLWQAGGLVVYASVICVPICLVAWLVALTVEAGVERSKRLPSSAAETATAEVQTAQRGAGAATGRRASAEVTATRAAVRAQRLWLLPGAEDQRRHWPDRQGRSRGRLGQDRDERGNHRQVRGANAAEAAEGLAAAVQDQAARAETVADRAEAGDAAFGLEDPMNTPRAKDLLSNPIIAIRPEIAMTVSLVPDVGGVIDFHQRGADLSQAASIGRTVEAQPIR